MEAARIKARLKNELGLHREIIALKQLAEEPAGIPAYGDLNNICYMMGEVLDEGKTFYTVLKDHVCLLGCAATGLDPGLQALSEKQRQESDDFHVSGINIFASEALQARAEQEAAALFPSFESACRAVVLGPFGAVPEPDALIMLGTPEQVHLLTRAYCYGTGSIVRGFAGMGVCRMLLPYVLINKEPVYTVSDRAWRRALKLAPDQLTLVMPPEKLVIMLDYLDACR